MDDLMDTSNSLVTGALFDSCVKFDPVYGTHIPNRDQLSPKVITRAISIGDVNKCAVCGARTNYAHCGFLKTCCYKHSRIAATKSTAIVNDAKTPEQWAAIKRDRDATMQAKYGETNPFKVHFSDADRVRRWGGLSPYCSPDVQSKVRQTMLDRYGVKYAMQNDELKNRCFESYKARTGIATPLSSGGSADEFRKSRDSTADIAELIGTMPPKEIASALGLHPGTVTRHLRQIDSSLVRTPSLIEGQMYDAIREHFPNLEIIRNTRSIIAPKEIDIYIPSLSLGVEMCGMYWHSEKFHDRKYHMDKFNAARDAGIHLMQVYDVEWENERRRNIFMSLLDVAAGNVKRVGARKLSLEKLSHKDANEFFDINHWQGGTRCSDAYGLVDGMGMIVQCMSIRSAVFYKQPAFEIARLCTVHGMVVPGGASKLLNAFIAEHDPKRIISYTDNRLFMGSSMQRLGFKASDNPQVGYMWYDPSTGRAMSRYAAFKGNLPRLLDDAFDPALSQNANMHNCGWVRVFDAGQTQWVMHRA